MAKRIIFAFVGILKDMNIIFLAQPIFFNVALLALLILVKPERVKKLWPCGLLGVIILFVTWQMLQALKLSWFVGGLMPIAGVPIVHLFWGFVSGILVVNFLPKEFIGKVYVIFMFTIISMIFEIVSEHITNDHAHSPVFTEVHNFVVNFVAIALLVLFSEGLFYNRIHTPAEGLVPG